MEKILIVGGSSRGLSLIKKIAIATKCDVILATPEVEAFDVLTQPTTRNLEIAASLVLGFELLSIWNPPLGAFGARANPYPALGNRRLTIGRGLSRNVNTTARHRHCRHPKSL